MLRPCSALALLTRPILATLLLVAPTAFAQADATPNELPRRTTVGTVVGRDGPIANATVCFVHRARGASTGPAADHVTVMTDARGRYRVKLWTGAKYCAWATVSENGAPAFASDVVWTDVAAVEEIRAVRRTSNAIVRLTGLEAWQDHGPFTVRWFVAGVPVPGEPTAVETDARPPEPSDDDSPWVRVPALPADLCTGVVCDARGEVIDHFRHQPAAPRPSQKIDPPREIPLFAATPDGQPVADVDVVLRVQTNWGGGDLYSPESGSRYATRHLGKTDGDGRLLAKVSARSDPVKASGWQQITLLAQKAGFATCHAGFRREPFTDGQEIERVGFEQLQLKMRPAAPLQGQVNGKGNAGLPFVLATDAFITAKKNNGSIHDFLFYDVETDEQGRFVVPGLPHHSKRAFLLPRPHAGTIAALSDRDRRTAPPNVLMFHPRSIATDGDREKGAAWNLDRTHPVTLRITDGSRGPATGTRVLFVSRRGEPECSWWTPSAVPDRAGRLTVRLEAGDWLVFARNARGMAHQKIDSLTDRELELQLAPMPAMTGRVVDEQGQPVAFARLDCHSSTYRSVPLRPDLEIIANSLNWRWLDAVRADAEGNFHCAFLDLPHMYYEAKFKTGKRESAEFKIVADEEPHTIVIPGK
ncbi:MAG: hypothetical protein NXI31_09755 [bacterium]|nr:hypothetical protein [bacterium]